MSNLHVIYRESRLPISQGLISSDKITAPYGPVGVFEISEHEMHALGWDLDDLGSVVDIEIV